jgi:hypothetical protein
LSSNTSSLCDHNLHDSHKKQYQQGAASLSHFLWIIPQASSRCACIALLSSLSRPSALLSTPGCSCFTPLYQLQPTSSKADCKFSISSSLQKHPLHLRFRLAPALFSLLHLYTRTPPQDTNLTSFLSNTQCRAETKHRMMHLANMRWLPPAQSNKVRPPAA